MVRHVVRVLIVAALLAIGWTVGRAQSATSDFEITVSARSGSAEVTCVRGCTLTWAPKTIPKEGPVEILVPQASLSATVTSSDNQGCLAPSRAPQNCRIWGYIKR